MDLWCMHAKSSDLFLRNSVGDKSISWDSRFHSLGTEMKGSRTESFPRYSRHRSSCIVKAMAKKNPGNHSNQNSGHNENAKSGGDGLKGNKSSDINAKKSPYRKPLDWREFRALLYLQEQAGNADPSAGRGPQALPLKWAHPISAPENGCLLVATEKLDGIETFERTVILLLRSGTENPQEGPFGVILNRPLNKKRKHRSHSSSNNELATTFANCSLHFGGPLNASMFLVKTGGANAFLRFDEVLPGLCFGSRNSLDDASALVKKGLLIPQDFRFFMGYSLWELDQLREEIELDYWHVAACSANLIFGVSRNSSDHLWQDILQLMGGHYSELSRKPKQDFF